jgi:excisionase family DNA binding protein
MNGSSVWTAGELAEAVDISREQVEELLEEGDIRGHNVGQHWVVLKREALRWLRSYDPEKVSEGSPEAASEAPENTVEDMVEDAEEVEEETSE